MAVTVRVLGLKELEKKLDGKVLYEPEIEAGLERIADEMKTRHDKRKGLGARRNVMAIERAGRLQMRVRSTPLVSGWQPEPRKGARRPKGSGTPRPGWQEKVPTYNPRRTGSAWYRAQRSRFKAMAPRVIRKAIEGIKARWSA